PPVLRIDACQRALLLTRRLVEILDEKAGNLTSATSEFNPREIANFWLRHAVNSAMAALRHIVVAKRGHPEELSVALSRLAGAVCLFSADSPLAKLPVL